MYTSAGRSLAFFRHHDLNILGERMQNLLPLRELAGLNSFQLGCEWFAELLLVLRIHVVESTCDVDQQLVQ